MRGDFVDAKPATTAAIRLDRFRRCGSGGVDVIEETTVDELLGHDGLASIFFREVLLMDGGKPELVAAQAVEFLEVVVTRVGPREREPRFAFDSEIELGGKFEVDELSRLEITEQEIEFADRRVGIATQLEILRQEIEAGRCIEEDSERILAEVAEFLLGVERRQLLRKPEFTMRKNFCLREVADQQGAIDEALVERG